MGKDAYIIRCEEEYDILYLPETFQIAKVEKDIDVEQIKRPIRKNIKNDTVDLQLGKGKVGITFMSARTCNLRCKYCFAGEGEYGNVSCKPKTLSADMYMSAIEMVLKEYPDGIKSISFFGGEPLIDFKEISLFVPKLVSICKSKEIECPRLSIITNLVLLTDEMAEFFKTYNIGVAISLDGGKEINDIARIGYTSTSVYDQVMKGIECLKRHNIKFLLQATINRNHLKQYKPGFAIEWAKNIEATGCSNYLAIPVESNEEDLSVVGELETLDNFIRELTKYYLEKLISDNSGIVPTGLVAPIFQFVHKKVVGNCKAGHFLLIDTDGKAYPCQMFCNDEKACIGNVENGLNEESVRAYANVSRFDSETCQNCIARNICVVFCKGIQLLSNGNMYEVCISRCIYQKAIMEECIKFLARLDKTSKEYVNLLTNYKKISERLMEDGFII